MSFAYSINVFTSSAVLFIHAMLQAVGKYSMNMITSSLKKIEYLLAKSEKKEGFNKTR